MGVFAPRAPLRRGGVVPLKAGGAERCAELYGAERDVGPRKELVVYLVLPRPLTPHISPLVAFRKRGGYWRASWRLVCACVAG